jgi:hypothetical protein
MPKVEPKTFEVAEYSDPVLDANTAYKTVRQIFAEYARDSAQYAVWADMSGDKLKIHFNSYEMFLPTRMNQVEEQSKQILDSTVKELKNEFKKRTGKALKLVEDKELANYSVEKVSLNDRYMYKTWRFYKMSF